MKIKDVVNVRNQAEWNDITKILGYNWTHSTWSTYGEYSYISLLAVESGSIQAHTTDIRRVYSYSEYLATCQLKDQRIAVQVNNTKEFIYAVRELGEDRQNDMPPWYVDQGIVSINISGNLYGLTSKYRELGFEIVPFEDFKLNIHHYQERRRIANLINTQLELAKQDGTKSEIIKLESTKVEIETEANVSNKADTFILTFGKKDLRSGMLLQLDCNDGDYYKLLITTDTGLATLDLQEFKKNGAGYLESLDYLSENLKSTDPHHYNVKAVYIITNSKPYGSNLVQENQLVWRRIEKPQCIIELEKAQAAQRVLEQTAKNHQAQISEFYEQNKVEITAYENLIRKSQAELIASK